MKIKVEKKRDGKAELLVLKTTKGEKLDYAQAELVRAIDHPALLAFAYETEHEDEVRFCYRITDTVPLETYLKAQLSLAQFREILDNVIDVIELCTDTDLDASRLLFDPRYLRLDAQDNRIAFAYIPASNLPTDHATAMDLLRFVAERASFVCSENAQDAAALLDYLKRQMVFSAVEFKVFLESTAFRKGTAQLAGTQTLTNPPKAAAVQEVFNFVTSGSGTHSAHERRENLSLVERVMHDVTDSGQLAPRENKTEAPAEQREPVPQASKPSTLPPENSTPDAAVHPTTSEPAPVRPFFAIRTADGSRFKLAAGETTMGRSKRCDVHVAHNQGISRVHALITVQDDTCHIVDQGSTNKTFVDDRELKPDTPCQLARGCTFKLADEEFRLE